MLYPIALLLPHRAPGAQRHNAAILGRPCLGIEVTEPALAAACQFGNLDPQHTGPGTGHAAITAALTAPVPPAGTTLVTIRPDADALGAMAVLTLRAGSYRPDALARRRIAAIDCADRFDHGAWSLTNATRATVPHRLAALARIAADASHPLEARIDVLATWLRYGVLPRTTNANCPDAARKLGEAVHRGDVTVTDILTGRIAFVRGNAPGALRLGYAVAPVVVAETASSAPSGRRRMTVAQFDAAHLDMRRVLARLQALEPGWGGSCTLIASPQGAPCALPAEAVLPIVIAAQYRQVSNETIPAASTARP